MPTKPIRADYAPNRNGESAYRRDLRAYEAALVIQQYGPRPARSEFPSGRQGAKAYNTALRDYGTGSKTRLVPLDGLVDIRGSVTPGSDEPALTNLGEGIQMDIAERSRAGAGYPEGVVRPDYYPVSTRNTYSGSAPAPIGDGLGTQTSPRQATPDEMLAFLGAIRNQAGANPKEIEIGRESMQFARPFAGLVQEESLNLPGEADVSRGDLEFYGYSPEEIDARMSGKGLEWSTDQEVDAPYKIVEQGTGAATKEDIKESMKVRQSEEKPEKRNYMIPYQSESSKARAAFLNAPDSMTGLKRRNLMRGMITASGKKWGITPEFLESNDPKDLILLTDEQVRAAKADEAQRFLNETLENINESPAGSQNPMLGQQSEASAVDPKASTDDPKSVQTYKENNQTPIELDADEVADMRFGGKTEAEIEELQRTGFLPAINIGG